MGDKYKPFFVEGKKYRVPGFLATSFSQQITRHFMRRARKKEKRVLWCIQLDERGRDDPLYQVQNVAWLTASHVKGEEEYLFSPYSVFKVVECTWSTDDESPHSIVVKAALDNQLEENN